MFVNNLYKVMKKTLYMLMFNNMSHQYMYRSVQAEILYCMIFHVKLKIIAKTVKSV